MRFFVAQAIAAEEVVDDEGFCGRGLKSRVKKYGLFQELFCVDGEEVKGDWAICNKRFVRRFHRHVIELRGDEN